jgi:hypothetical protein
MISEVDALLKMKGPQQVQEVDKIRWLAKSLIVTIPDFLELETIYLAIGCSEECLSRLVYTLYCRLRHIL